MKIKASELIGAALDYAVALVNGCSDDQAFDQATSSDEEFGRHRYSTDWKLGGPIIEDRGVTIIRRIDDAGLDWWATTEVSDVRTDYHPIGLTGPTALIAAMRVVVDDELGAEVDIPDELLN